MARAKAKLSQKRASKYVEKPSYSPEKKKDRKKAREKRKQRREKTKEYKKPASKEEPIKSYIPSQQDEPQVTEVEFLIDRIYEKIRDIANKMLPYISDKVSDICLEAFTDFVNDVSPDMDGLADALRSILTDAILNQEVYDSDQTEMARMWADELKQLAGHLKSNALYKMAEDGETFEDINEDEFMDVVDMFPF